MAFPVNGVIENFNRADEFPLSGSGNWGVISSAGGALWLTGNQLQNWSGEQTGFWTPAVTSDQEAYMAVVTVPAADSYAAIWLRVTDTNSTTFDGYQVAFIKRAGTDECTITRYDNGTPTLISGPHNAEYANGDRIGADIIGTTITAYLFTGSWASVGSTTDATYATGSIGFASTGSTPGHFDDFGGGSAAAVVSNPDLRLISSGLRW